MRHALRYASRLFAAVLFTTSQMPVWAETPAAAATEAPPTDVQLATEEARSHVGGRLTVGGRIGESQAEGYLDAFQPLAGGENSVLFLNPKLSGSDSEEEEISLGLGFRALCPKVDALAGVNVFYDSRRTSHDNTFDQYGAGLEVLSTWVDARANYYWPDDKQEMIERTSDTEVDRYVDHSYSDLYAEGHQILQLEKIKTTTITTTRFFERFEAALEGYDLEVGVRLPYLPDWLETRVFAGYYAFEGDFTEDIDGFKGRLEIRALPILTLDAEIYEDDALAGSDYFVGARVNVPFDLANLARGKNPFAGTSEQVRRAKRTFRDRLNEMVIRDPHVRIHESGYIENEGLKQVETDIDRDENELVILDDVNFVNNKNTGFENGTDEHPYNTVQEGVDNVFGDKNVYVYKGIKSYRENVRIEEDGVSLLGEGCAIEGFGGEKFGGGKYPVLNGNVGGVNGPVIRVTSDDVLIRGFEITRSPGGIDPGNVDGLGFGMTIDQVGILGENADNLTIGCNRIHNQTYGVMGLYDPTEPGAPQDYHITVRGNTIEDSTFGVQFFGQGSGGGRFTGSIADNRFDNIAAQEIYAQLDLLSDASLSIDGNTFDGGSSFVLLNITSISNDAALDITGNTARQGLLSTITLGPVGRDLDIDISGNRLLGGLGPSFLQVTLAGGVGRNARVGLDGNYVESGTATILMSPVGGDSDVSFSGNTFMNAGGGALTLINSTVGGDAILRLDNNSIVSPLGAGITAILPATIGNDLYLSTSGNYISDALGAGITLAGGGSMNNAYVSMRNNRIRNSAGAGLTATFGTITGNAVIATSGNRINDNSGNGMTLLLGSVAGNADISVINSEFNGNAGTGFTLLAPSVGGTLNVVIDPTTANDNGGPGMSLTLNSVGDLRLALQDVQANDNAGPGVVVSANSASGSVQAAFVNVQANDNGGPGIQANLTAEDDVLLMGGPSSGPLVPNEVQANHNAGGGMLLFANSASGQVVEITRRLEASGNSGPGISRTFSALQSVQAMLGDVVANTNSGPGVSLGMISTSNSGMLAMSSLRANGNSGPGATLLLTGEDGVVAAVGTDLMPMSSQPSAGGVEVNGNGGPGLVATIISSQDSATLIVGDIAANDNSGPGVSATISGDDDVQAIFGYRGIAGGVGDVEANHNQGPGISAGLNSAQGLAGFSIGNGEASGNTGPGVAVFAGAGDSAIAGFGTMMIGGVPSALGNSFSARTNGGPGLSATLSSTGEAAALIYAGGNLSDNAGPGASFNVAGHDGATLLFGGLLLGGNPAAETVATNNTGSGIMANLNSEVGGARIFADGLRLNDNGGYGMTASLTAQDDVTAILGISMGSSMMDINTERVEFSGNAVEGLYLYGQSLAGDVTVNLPDFVANENVAGSGVNLTLVGNQGATLALGALFGSLPVVPETGSGVANANQGSSGIRAAVLATNGDVTVLLGAIEASGNNGQGVDLTLDAKDEVNIYAGVIPQIAGSLVAHTNTGDGIRVMAVGEEVTMFVGDAEASGNSGNGMSIVMSGTKSVSSIFGMRSEGGTNFVAGDLQFHNNAAGNGLSVAADSVSGTVNVAIGQFAANANGISGVSVDVFGEDAVELDIGSFVVPSVFSLETEGVASGNASLSGVNIEAESYGSLTARVANITAVTNGSSGIAMLLFASNNVDVIGYDNALRNNQIGLQMAADGAVLNLDFGGGALGSAGNNSFTGNSIIGVTNAGSGTVVAQQNWWGTPAPVLNTDFGVNVDASSPLAADPNP